jgi:hypothetical protein
LRTVPIFSLFFLLSAPLFGDELYLVGGAKFTGRIEQQTDTMITINIGDGVIGLPTSRVERIVRGRSPLDEHEERARRLGPDDVEGWRSLARAAVKHGLSAQSRQAYQHVMTLVPDDPEARHALGFVKHDGQWMTEEDSYRARGFVKYEGEWMTPEEAQLAQAAFEADEARRDAELRATEAEVQAAQAEARAQEAEERAREAEERNRWNDPVYWGGWGYGLNVWPSTSAIHYGTVVYP